MAEKIKALLVDDEKNSREVLNKLLEKYFQEVEIVGEASSVDDAYDLIISEKPDLVFLDIQMPRENGFNLLMKFDKVPFEVIFVTSFDHYAITAIRFNALDYLLKPIEIKDLKNAVQKAIISAREKRSKQPQIISLLYSLGTDLVNRKLAVHTGEKVKMLSEQNIIFIEGDGRYCHLYMDTGEHFTTPKNLKDFEDYFGEKSTLIRISKSFIINATHIKEYSKGDPFIIEMVNEKTFEVARRKKPKVLGRLK
ncbi:MAG: response regulator [Chitinophagaceae bacterium]|nr:response regulator [Chitinophagaceae bacterium]